MFFHFSLTCKRSIFFSFLNSGAHFVVGNFLCLFPSRLSGNAGWDESDKTTVRTTLIKGRFYLSVSFSVCASVCADWPFAHSNLFRFCISNHWQTDNHHRFLSSMCESAVWLTLLHPHTNTQHLLSVMPALFNKFHKSGNKRLFNASLYFIWCLQL